MAGNFKITDKSTVNPTVNDYTLVSQNGSTKNTTFARIKQLLLGTTALNTTNTEINGAINEVNDLATNAKSTADSMKTTVGTGILQTTSQNIIGGVNEVNSRVGVETLETTAQNCTSAINELKTKEEDNKTEILNTIGDEEMGTTATTLKGGIAEVNSHLNEKANQSDLNTINSNFENHKTKQVIYKTLVSRDAQTTGIQTITLPFTPKAVQIKACIYNTKYASIGNSDGRKHNCLSVLNVNSNYGIYEYVVFMNSGGVDYVCATATFDENSIALTWVKQGTSVTGTITLDITATTH